MVEARNDDDNDDDVILVVTARVEMFVFSPAFPRRQESHLERLQ